MPEVLQLAKLVELHSMSKVQIGPGRVEAFLDSQRLAALELGFQLGLDDQLIRASFEDGQLVGKVDGHGCGGVMERLLQSGGPRVRPRQGPQLTPVKNSAGNSVSNFSRPLS